MFGCGRGRPRTSEENSAQRQMRSKPVGVPAATARSQVADEDAADLLVRAYGHGSVAPPSMSMRPPVM